MTKRLLSRDDELRLSTYHEYDHQTDETRIIYEGDDMPTVEQNKLQQNDPDFTKKGIKQEFWKYASIPAGVQVKWLLEHGVDIYNKDHGARIGRLLEDPQYKYLKCTTKYHKIK